MKKKNRYFIVFFRANFNGGYATANTCFITGGEYLNQKETIKQVQEINSSYFEIVITNIIELNSQEFNDWTK